MSYEIIYDKQFVKAGDKYIPIVLIGSNNCTERSYSGRERRERDWYNIMTYKGKQLWTREELLQHCAEERQRLMERWKDEGAEKDIEQRFGSYASLAIGSGWYNTTYGKYKGLFITGMKKALTVEQLAEFRVYLQVNTHRYNIEETKKKCTEKNIIFLEEHYPKTTEELLNTINKFQENYNGTGISWYVNFTNGAHMEYEVKNIRRKLFSKKRSEYKYVQRKRYYTILAFNGWYFWKFTKYGYRYSQISDKYRFLTKKEAEQFIKSKGRRGEGLKVKFMQSDYPVNVKVKIK